MTIRLWLASTSARLARSPHAPFLPGIWSSMVAPFLLLAYYTAKRCRASTLAHAASMFRTISALLPCPTSARAKGVPTTCHRLQRLKNGLRLSRLCREPPRLLLGLRRHRHRKLQFRLRCPSGLTHPGTAPASPVAARAIIFAPLSPPPSPPPPPPPSPWPSPPPAPPPPPTPVPPPLPLPMPLPPPPPCPLPPLLPLQKMQPHAPPSSPPPPPPPQPPPSPRPLPPPLPPHLLPHPPPPPPCVALHTQCGGFNHVGATTCCAGMRCHVYSQYYSGCLPVSNNI
mmetsp:Transcript_13396/g.35135  ORF Transcript_13396/g.35135 Transcript_13396/m.35135 type:complete len:284 (+) Transcript_13396:315-1166(+)